MLKTHWPPSCPHPGQPFASPREEMGWAVATVVGRAARERAGSDRAVVLDAVIPEAAG